MMMTQWCACACVCDLLQKLYRFINCVELLSPHHAAKELMHSLRQGQITSLFQKSVKRVNKYTNTIDDNQQSVILFFLLASAERN